MDKYFIVLGASRDQIYLIKNIHKLNYKTIVFDKNKNSPGFKIANLSFAIDFKNYKKVIIKLNQLKKKSKIHYQGIITMGCDVPYIISRIAKEFNLQKNSLKSSLVSENKYLMKKLFTKANIRTAKYSILKNLKQAENFWNKNKCKGVILKPVDNSGSKGVQLLVSKNQLKNAFEIVKNNTKKKYFIIEEFLDGPQLSTESIIYKNKIYTPGLSHREYKDIKFFLPQILENGGTASLKFQRFLKKINLEIKKITSALNMDRGVIKGDFVINKNKLNIIEFTTRLSGGDFSESVAPLSNGVNYVKEAIKIAANQSISVDNLKPKFSKIVANRYFFLPPGNLNNIKGISKVRKIKEVKKLEFYNNINSRIPKIDSHGKRIGIFIVVSNTEKRLKKVVENVYKNLLFKVNNSWIQGKPESMKKTLHYNNKLKFINMFR